MNSITILAPAFNEEENIVPFLEHFYPKIDENWQIEHWGSDVEAQIAREEKRTSFIRAAQFFKAC